MNVKITRTLKKNKENKNTIYDVPEIPLSLEHLNSSLIFKAHHNKLCVNLIGNHVDRSI